MCGIVGLLVKKSSLRASLGKMVAPMLTCMGDRGADSAGLAVFSEPLAASLRRYSLYAPQRDFHWTELKDRLQRETNTISEIVAKENHASLASSIDALSLKSWLSVGYPELHLLSVGHAIDVFKDTGHPDDLERRYGFSKMTGSHAVGHTRMATESAVSPAHSHPFTAGEDF
jgi:glutamate synthase domain-containing protein 1